MKRTCVGRFIEMMIFRSERLLIKFCLFVRVSENKGALDPLNFNTGF